MGIECTFQFEPTRYLDPEDAAFVLNEIFERAVEITEDNYLKVWFQDQETELLNLKTIELNQYGIELTAQIEIGDQNWTQKCPELFAPLQIADLTICPVEGLETVTQKPEKDQIFIIPGTGFGTGHHPTTAMIIAMLQKLKTNQFKFGSNANLTPNQILDLGTGSGLLAVVAERVFNTAVDAIDNDDLALKNAFDNLELNGCTQIKLRHGSISAATGPYELILANLYAELLVEFQAGLADLLAPGGLLIVSGIMQERHALVKSTFSESGWQIITEESQGNWTAMQMIKG